MFGIFDPTVCLRIEVLLASVAWDCWEAIIGTAEAVWPSRWRSEGTYLGEVISLWPTCILYLWKDKTKEYHCKPSCDCWGVWILVPWRVCSLALLYWKLLYASLSPENLQHCFQKCKSKGYCVCAVAVCFTSSSEPMLRALLLPLATMPMQMAASTAQQWEKSFSINWP